jgi:hypothetical protein
MWLRLVIIWDGNQVVMGSIGNITLTSKEWHHMHIESCLKHCMHICLLVSCMLDELCDVVHLTNCVHLTIVILAMVIDGWIR